MAVSFVRMYTYHSELSTALGFVPASAWDMGLGPEGTPRLKGIFKRHAVWTLHVGGVSTWLDYIHADCVDVLAVPTCPTAVSSKAPLHCLQVKDLSTVIPRNSLIEANQSGLIAEPLIDITPQLPIPQYQVWHLVSKIDLDDLCRCFFDTCHL